MNERAPRHRRLAPQRFIAENLQLAPVPSLPELRLYTGHPGSRLSRLAARQDGDPPPYWAYPWAGGLVLARYILDRPEAVTSRRVLELGAGSGLVGIAAMKAGARTVIAAEIDGNGRAALGLNAAANGVALAITGEDFTAGPPPDVDLVTVGDLFYEAALAARVTAFLDCCRGAGIAVLIGDVGRAHLPRTRLRILAECPVPDFGDSKDTAQKPGAVFAFTPSPA